MITFNIMGFSQDQISKLGMSLTQKLQEQGLAANYILKGTRVNSNAMLVSMFVEHKNNQQMAAFICVNNDQIDKVSDFLNSPFAYYDDVLIIDWEHESFLDLVKDLEQWIFHHLFKEVNSEISSDSFWKNF